MFAIHMFLYSCSQVLLLAMVLHGIVSLCGNMQATSCCVIKYRRAPFFEGYKFRGLRGFGDFHEICYIDSVNGVYTIYGITCVDLSLAYDLDNRGRYRRTYPIPALQFPNFLQHHGNRVINTVQNILRNK